MLAIDVRDGDVLAYDGRVFEVVRDPEGATWTERGEHVQGLEIACQDTGGRLFLYRRATELLSRIRAGGAS